MMVKLIDPSLTDFGTKDNPIFMRYAAADVLSIQSITNAPNSTMDTLLISAVPEKKICVFAISVFAEPKATTCTITFSDGIAGPSLYQILIAAGMQTGFVSSESISLPSHLFSTSPGNGLYINISDIFNSVANLSYFLG